jgi:hypothetical protein
MEGSAVGSSEGAAVGINVGLALGAEIGRLVGVSVNGGPADGTTVGYLRLGLAVMGRVVGLHVGFLVGVAANRPVIETNSSNSAIQELVCIVTCDDVMIGGLSGSNYVCQCRLPQLSQFGKRLLVQLQTVPRDFRNRRSNCSKRVPLHRQHNLSTLT